jgi:type II secretory ATPase GspE/PulE/Tfp pilus assembly ATPase PilB-like protein
VKVLAKLKLDERRKPQDGRFTASVSGHKIDFRVSILPTFFGEKVVIRILDSSKTKKTRKKKLKFRRID